VLFQLEDYERWLHPCAGIIWWLFHSQQIAAASGQPRRRFSGHGVFQSAPGGKGYVFQNFIPPCTSTRLPTVEPSIIWYPMAAPL